MSRLTHEADPGHHTAPHMKSRKPHRGCACSHGYACVRKWWCSQRGPACACHQCLLSNMAGAVPGLWSWACAVNSQVKPSLHVGVSHCMRSCTVLGMISLYRHKQTQSSCVCLSTAPVVKQTESHQPKKENKAFPPSLFAGVRVAGQ